MREYEIFTGQQCRYCDAAKTLLEERGLAFIERNTGDPAVLKEFRERLPRVKSIPQIFYGNIHIGGFEDLKQVLAMT